jgi:hypothetical protein
MVACGLQMAKSESSDSGEKASMVSLSNHAGCDITAWFDKLTMLPFPSKSTELLSSIRNLQFAIRQLPIVGVRSHVVRGGSYINNDRNVRCAYRNRNTPDNINDNQGFRVVLLRSRSSNDDG